MLGAERKSLVMREEERRLTAYHEAGHAVCAVMVKGNDPLHKVTIVPRGRALGIAFTLPEDDRVSVTREQLEARLVMAYGGRAAEEIVFGRDRVTTGAASDIQQATAIARRYVTQWGLSDAIGPDPRRRQRAGGLPRAAAHEPSRGLREDRAAGRLRSEEGDRRRLRSRGADAHGTSTPARRSRRAAARARDADARGLRRISCAERSCRRARQCRRRHCRRPRWRRRRSRSRSPRPLRCWAGRRSVRRNGHPDVDRRQVVGEGRRRAQRRRPLRRLQRHARADCHSLGQRRVPGGGALAGHPASAGHAAVHLRGARVGVAGRLASLRDGGQPALGGRRPPWQWRCSPGCWRGGLGARRPVSLARSSVARRPPSGRAPPKPRSTASSCSPSSLALLAAELGAARDERATSHFAWRSSSDSPSRCT